MIYTIVSDFFDICTLIIFFNTTLVKRYNKIPYPVFLLCFALYEIVGFITNNHFNYITGKNYLYIVTLVSITTIFSLTFLYTASIKMRLLTAISYQLIGGLSESIIFTIISLLPRDDSQKILSNNGLCLALSQICVFIFIMIGRLFLRKKRNQLLTTQYSILVLFMPVLTIFVMITIPETSSTSTFHKFLNIFAITGLLVANIVNYTLLNSLLKVKELEITKAQLNDRLEYQAKKYLLLSTTYKNSRRIIHDTKKHYFYIRECLHKQMYNEIDKYLDTSIGDMEQTFNRINTGNLVIDSFVSNYMMVAEQNNIVFKTDIKVDLENIQISDYDFSIILGNLLDNCYNACEKVLPPKKREIDVDIFTTDFELVIHLYNTFIPEKTKYDDDQLIHGYGTANVNNITLANRGTYTNFIKHDMYHAVVSIPCNIDKHKKNKLPKIITL